MSSNLIRDHISSFDGFNYLFMGTLNKTIHSVWNSEKKTSIRCVSKNRVPVWLDNLPVLNSLPVHFDNESVKIFFEHSFKNGYSDILTSIYDFLELDYKKKLVNTALKMGVIGMVKWIHANTMDAHLLHGGDTIAAYHGHLDIVKWFVIYFNFKLNGHLDMYGVLGGSIEIMEWLADNEIECRRNNLCILASRSGHLDMLKYLIKNNHEFDPSDCRRFAKHGSGVKEWVEKNSI